MEYEFEILNSYGIIFDLLEFNIGLKVINFVVFILFKYCIGYVVSFFI